MNKVEHIKPYGTEGAKEQQVEAMFDAIAPAYDFMNRAMTACMDRLWLRRLLKACCSPGASVAVDLATGTGDVALAIARRCPDAAIIGIDLSAGMLAKAREKAEKQNLAIDFRQADCLATGLPDAVADFVTVAYGVRNFADIEAGYREMHRILRPGGMLCVLELSTPTALIPKLFYNLYTRLLIPAAGSIIAGDRKAYAYLPESIAAAPQRADMERIMRNAGFTRTTSESMTMGVCTLYTAYKQLQ